VATRGPLAARGVRFSYEAGRPILCGVDLDVRPGELLALFGPNGAGKSTLLRILSGRLAPDEGRVEVDGRPAASYGRRGLARLVATVPQETAVHLPYTVGEIALMGRAPYVGRLALEGRADVAAARAALEAVGLWALRDRPAGEVSGGERQRAVIARALAQEAPFLVLDEPTAFLDVRHQVAVYRLLRELAHRDGRAILAASHDVNLAAQYADRAALLGRDGRLAAVGAPGEVLRPDLLREVFEAEVEVARHARTGRPYIVFGGD
jgi:iron complex transport system ATP-binding protein